MNFSKPHKKFLISSGTVGVCVLALASCGPQAANFSIDPVSQAMLQSNVANNKVDILWVIKNSGTMLVKQQLLATSFNSFISNFSNSGFDFQMGIVTADITGTGQGAILQGNPAILTQNTANLAAAFTTNVEVGDTGSFQQTSFDATLQGLGATLLNGSNAGFIRSDAQLAVIYVSDSDEDYSTNTTTNVYNFLNTLKPPIYDEVTKTNKPAFTISGVIADDTRTDFELAECTLNGVPYYENGLKFETLINQTGGSEAQICNSDFASGLTNISTTIVEAITSIPLGRVPNVSTIVVAFNGTPVAEDPTNGWQYNASNNTIYFYGTAIPTTNTNIVINYTPNDIIR
jgi:hypothetical protein